MSLSVSFLDFHRAKLDQRAQLAFSGQRREDILTLLSQAPGVEGVVLLSTCNRTEVYLSGDCATPWRLLCQAAGLREDGFSDAFLTYTGEDAARHLMEVSCGLCSQILCEDQILTQVREAMQLAQELGTADKDLSALFRIAVTVGKRSRTEIHFNRQAPSMATRCTQLLRHHLGTLEARRILVIGNGQMGQLAARTLAATGAQVSVTLRSYHHGESVVPSGCHAVPYDDRLSAMEGIDAVISATTSPHYTITAGEISSCAEPPKILIDLAVPRDIDPGCARDNRVICYDTDSLGASGPDNTQQLSQVRQLIAQHLAEFQRWKRRQGSGSASAFRFPLFVDLTGKRVVLVGGGSISARRVSTLRLFGCEIVVISPELSFNQDGIQWIRRSYLPGDLEGAALAIAATNHRSVNHQVGEDAKALGIPVSVADCEGECTFFFPAICAGDQVVAGVVSHGKDHHATARAAKAIRKVLEELP